MSRALFWLSDEAWAAIEPHLPKNQPGARRVDDRRVISGIIHMLKCGGRWADCPAEYGPATTVYNRWNRWSRRGIWTRILAALTEDGWIAETGQIDSGSREIYLGFDMTREPVRNCYRLGPAMRFSPGAAPGRWAATSSVARSKAATASGCSVVWARRKISWIITRSCGMRRC